LFAALLGSTRVQAQTGEPFASLDYRTDPELRDCPAAAQFQALVAGELGREPFESGAPERALVAVKRGNHGIEGVVTWFDRKGAVKGERELGSDTLDCGAFARELAFAVAVQLELMDRERAATSEPPATPAAPPPPLELDPGVTAEEQPLRWLLGAGPVVAFGLAPATTFEGRLFLALRRKAWSAELGGEISTPSTYRDPDENGFEYRLLSLSFSACGHLDPVALCGQARATRLSVHGVGVDEPESASGVLAQAGARLMVSQTIGPRFAASLHVDALATLTPRTVTLNDRGVWTTPAIVLLAGIDAAVELP
jgi:hypothetical protein